MKQTILERSLNLKAVDYELIKSILTRKLDNSRKKKNTVVRDDVTLKKIYTSLREYFDKILDLLYDYKT